MQAWENADAVVAQARAFVSGVLADGAINEAEAAALHKLLESRKELDRFYRALERTPPAQRAAIPKAALDALCDDLNTPLALSAMHTLADAAMAGDSAAAAGLLAAGAILGLLQTDPADWFRGPADDSAAIEAAIAERIAARAAKNFARADAIRQQLTDKGIQLEDGPAGTIWRRT